MRKIYTYVLGILANLTLVIASTISHIIIVIIAIEYLVILSSLL